MRFGLKRAEGPTTHPIWFGMIQCLLFPYVLAAANLAWRRRGPRWWLVLPAVTFLGVFFTLSRGPLLCLVISSAVFAIVRYRVRWPYLVGGLAIVVVALSLGAGEIREWLRWSEGTRARQAQIELSGVKYRADSANYRFYVLRAYFKAIQEAPLWGYGSERLAVWPPLVPLDADARVVLTQVWSIDDEYLLLLLRLGWMGLACFAAMVLLAAFFALRRTWVGRDSLEARVLAASLGATITALSLLLAGEWMPSDWGFFLLYSLGFAGCLGEAGTLPHFAEKPTIWSRAMRPSAN